MDYIYHHGIKGQKWGIRRTPAQLGHDTPDKKKEGSLAKKIAEGVKKTTEDIKSNNGINPNSQKPKIVGNLEKRGGMNPNVGNPKPKVLGDARSLNRKQSVHEMSDVELRNRLTRLNMEQQYKKLNPSRIERGKKILFGTIAAIGTTVGLINNVKKLYGTYQELKDIIPLDVILRDLDD